jgi:uncharacterized protein YkwD
MLMPPVTRRFAVILMAWLLVPGVSLAQAVEADDTETIVSPGPSRQGVLADTDQAAQQIVDATNRFRQQEDLQAVSIDPALGQAARDFAGYMARTNKYGHTADGQRPAERASQQGYEYCIVLENIAYQYSSAGFPTDQLAARFVQGWKDSPGHRKNMLDPDVTQTGVGVAHSEKSGVYYAVQMFGRPESERFEFQVVNRSGEEVQYTIGERTIPLPPRATVTHQRCRPSQLTFQGSDDSQPQPVTVKPQPGSKLIIQRGPSGELQVIRQ